MSKAALGVINGNQGVFSNRACEGGIEHHVALSLSQLASALHEALNKQMNWDIHYHGASGPESLAAREDKL